MAQYSEHYQPDKDTGWGLIFRLNALWERVDRRAEAGDYSGWELILDRIFCNLMYRNESEVETNGDNEIISVEINDEEYNEWRFVKQKIQKAKKKIAFAQKNKNIGQLYLARLEVYNTITFYDIWLRKFMQARRLYLKEVESNPSKALFGGAFGK